MRDRRGIYHYSIPPAGCIIPGGWIKTQLERDLSEGYVGKFDRVHPTVAKDVFVKQNRISKGSFRFEKEWWSGEHEGYWKDAVARMAFLTGNQEYMERAHQWIRDIIEGAGTDGYIGIYDDCGTPNCRFRHVKGNGELWATSRILMAMLAVYEFTGESRMLDAAESAVLLVIRQYSGSNYFLPKSRGGGISHGIGFFEILEWLYRITGDNRYLEFARKLYDDFNNSRVRDDDLQTDRLLETERLFRKHGAHIAEGLFVPQMIAEIENSSELRKASGNVLHKLYEHITPGGAMRCDEWIKGRLATADERYEYCGMAEMVSPLNKIISLSGNAMLADRIETMVFNAAQGARLPVLSALSYLTSDNRIKINHCALGLRESYDAVHPAAACCVLNGARLMPYFVEGMWMREANDNAVMAMLFGPCEFNTHIRGVELKISEKTRYPFSDDVRFVFNPGKPVSFRFEFRKPHGCNSAETSHPEGAEMTDKEDRISIFHRWEKGDEVNVRFNFDIKKVKQPRSSTVPGEGMYIKRGALVYSLPFEHKLKKVREYRDSGFYRYRIFAEDRSLWKTKVAEGTEFEYIPAGEDDPLYPWDGATVHLKGSLIGRKNKSRSISLVPMGNTIFRRVTFPIR